MIYLDNSATTPIHPEVLKAMMPYLKGGYGNAGAVYRIGRESAKAIQKAREQVAQLFNASADQIIFTSGGSEGNNMVFSYGMRCMLEEQGKKHVVISQIEHDSVYEAATHMFKPSGKVNIKDDFYTHFVSTNEDGTVNMEDLERILRTDKQVGLVSIMYVNNETGAVNPIKEISRLCHESGVLFHTDCVQAAGCHVIDVENIQCDYATISGHKIHAPKGVGAIYIRNNEIANPLIYGGAHQEYGLRGGTENVAGIIGLGKACELATNSIGRNMATVCLLKRLFYEEVLGNLDKTLGDIVHINGPGIEEQGKTLNMRIENVDSETLLLLLDGRGICISAGSACHSHESSPSRVLTAMGLSDDQARDSVRISFSSDNIVEEVEEAARIFASAVCALKRRCQ